MLEEDSDVSAWEMLQSDLVKLLTNMPLHDFLTLKELFKLFSYKEISRLHHSKSILTLMSRCQRANNDQLWVKFMSIAKSLSEMSESVVAWSCNDDARSKIFDSINSCLTDSRFSCWTHSRISWILCWLCVLESDLNHHTRVFLTKYINKILVNTVQYLKELYGGEMVTMKSNDCAVATILGLRLLESLVVIPRKVGLISRSVVVLMHAFSIVNTDVLITSPSVLLEYEQLLLLLVFNHSTTLGSCPSTFLAPLITILLQCISSIVAISQISCSHSDSHVTHQAVITFTRLMEALSQEAWFTKIAAYCVAQYLVSSQQAPMDRKLKGILVSSGILLLFKLLSDGDRNYLLSSLDEQGKENLLNLFEDYNKFYKFTGKV